MAKKPEAKKELSAEDLVKVEEKKPLWLRILEFLGWTRGRGNGPGTVEETKKTVALDETLRELIGKPVLVFCVNYIYTGILAGVGEKYVMLFDPSIVYETGAFDDAKFKDAQKMPSELLVSAAAIESICETNKV